MRALPRRKRRQSDSRRRADDRPVEVRPHRYDEDRAVLQVRHHALRRHAPVDAVPGAEDAEQRRALCALGLHPRAQQDHPRGRGDGCQDLAPGEDAEPRQLHRLGPGQDRLSAGATGPLIQAAGRGRP